MNNVWLFFCLETIWFDIFDQLEQMMNIKLILHSVWKQIVINSIANKHLICQLK